MARSTPGWRTRASSDDPADADYPGRMTEVEQEPARELGGARRSRPAALAGMAGGLIGATCCIGPAVGVAIGAGSGSFLLAMAGYRLHAFAVGAVAAFAVAAWLLARRRRACPTDAAYRSLRSRWLDAGIIAFAVTYAVGRFVVSNLIERL